MQNFSTISVCLIWLTGKKRKVVLYFDRRQTMNKLSKTLKTVSCGLLLACSPALFLEANASDRDTMISSAHAANPADESPYDSVVSQVEALMKQSFPKAKIKRTDKSFNASFKCRQFADSGSSSRLVLAPDLDGILLDMELKEGEYTGNQRVPRRTNEVLYISLVMAPYSKKLNSHLSTKILLPHNTPDDVIREFESIIAQFGPPQPEEKKKEEEVKPAATAVPATPAASTPTAKPPDAPKSTFGPPRLSTFTFTDGRFQIKLPERPEGRSRDQRGMRFVDYTYAETQGIFNIGFTVLPGYVPQEQQGKMLTDFIRNLGAASKGKPTSLTWLPWHGYPGRQMDIAEIPNKGFDCSRLRVILVRRYLYVVQAVGTKAWLESPGVSEVLDSLVIRPELTEEEQATWRRQQEALHSNSSSDSSKPYGSPYSGAGSIFDKNSRSGRSQFDKDWERGSAQSKFGRHD